MLLGTIISFRDNSERPQAELTLRNGDRVRLALDGGGVVISQIGASGSQTALFKGSPDTVGRICAGLVASPRRLDATPLRILASAIIQIESAAELQAAFDQAAAQAL
jgi:hypothetical protein